MPSKEFFRNQDYSRRSIAMDDQSGPIGADDAILHRERVSKSGGRADICGRTPRAWLDFRWTCISAVAGDANMSTYRCAHLENKMESFRDAVMLGRDCGLSDTEHKISN